MKWLRLAPVVVVFFALCLGLMTLSTYSQSGDELGSLPVTVTVIPGDTVDFWSDASMSNRMVALYLGSEREQWTVSQTSLYVSARRNVGVVMDVVGVPPGAVTFSPATIAMEVGVVYEVTVTIHLDELGEHTFSVVPREL
jgi:plastocyanin